MLYRARFPHELKTSAGKHVTFASFQRRITRASFRREFPASVSWALTLVLITNSKSHTGVRLVQKSVTLNDLYARYLCGSLASCITNVTFFTFLLFLRSFRNVFTSMLQTIRAQMLCIGKDGWTMSLHEVDEQSGKQPLLKS